MDAYGSSERFGLDSLLTLMILYDRFPLHEGATAALIAVVTRSSPEEEEHNLRSLVRHDLVQDSVDGQFRLTQEGLEFARRDEARSRARGPSSKSRRAM